MKLAILLAATTLALAGCLDNAPDELESAAAQDAPTATAATTTPLTFDGSIGPMLYACPGVTCEGVEPAGNRWLPIDIDTDLTAISLTMTWDATTPNMEVLRFGIGWGEDNYESIEGTSPLVLEKSDLTITPGDEPYLWTWVPTPAPMGLATAGTPQDFHIEGNLTTTDPTTTPQSATLR